MSRAPFPLMPLAVRRSLVQLGVFLGIARRKRSVTAQMMTERLGIAKGTYRRIEKGDPTVAMGFYAMALFVLGFGTPLPALVDPGQDDQGQLLDVARLPKRVRIRKTPGTS